MDCTDAGDGAMWPSLRWRTILPDQLGPQDRCARQAALHGERKKGIGILRHAYRPGWVNHQGDSDEDKRFEVKIDLKRKF